ncbi:GNAT family N-acetyltransferase [Streptomyces sp. IMTB 2501]|uniref:GNAT family N-acetyltransferase n=1 Tax=Streptomyces sp. IMTB 2501 TaxID=1776340 RepID=UPI00096DF7FB|nr:N-acetyltransferase [Streptomyces sp. IMTB 2501]OLZ65378.1 GNAT family N-acetyltransferase [Streptomyces sp. IMTB 2501]
MKIRTEAPNDAPHVREVITRAFGSPEDAELVDALRTDVCWIPELSLVAEDDHGRVIAHALLTRASIGTAPSLALAPVSVAPEHQGLGVGSALIRAALDTARNTGERTVTVLGHPTYYPRFGFEPAAAHGVTCTLSAGPDEAKMVLSLDGSPIPTGDMSFGKPMTDAVRAYQPEQPERTRT